MFYSLQINRNLIGMSLTKLLYLLLFLFLSGVVATAEDPSAITSIQSAATFSSEQPIKYLFKTEGAGGQVGELYPPIGQVGQE